MLSYKGLHAVTPCEFGSFCLLISFKYTHHRLFFKKIHLSGISLDPIFRTAFNSSWDRFNKVLEMFGSYWHDSITLFLHIMRISCYTTSQSCSVGLRSGDCGVQ